MFLRRRWELLAMALWGLLWGAPLWARHAETGFLNRTAIVDGVTYKYQVFVPSNWSKKTKWPIILFLHGYGEEGEDGLLQTQVGLAAAIRSHVDRFPFVVVMPQCRKEDWWTNAPMEAQALKALDQTMQEFKGDPQRVYLTGLSMGGYGTWALGSQYSGKFAALVPVCGGIRLPPGHDIVNAHDTDTSADPYTAVAQKIGKTPVWVFHGGADPVVPVTESRQMVEALKKSDGNVRYTEYPGVEHNSWEKAYDQADLFTWLMAQKLGQAK
ncbi:MAG TPA: prolyl oligopeptidase family serine peptidase [Terriglobia bacterium]|nr:prolyl oligopeptidase family serine peptidase [Terriglobia bacterium]